MNENLLEQILALESLQATWKRVKQHQGTAGINGQSIADYPHWFRQLWSGIKRGLMAGYFILQPISGWIPKLNGGKRLLDIPSVND